MAQEADDPTLVVADRATGITPKLYACRDAARWLLGDGYRHRMSELGTALRSTASAANCGVLQAAADAARGVEGIDALQIVAAAVELLEPSA